MKKTFFTFSILACMSVSGQKKYANILNSTNISEIESFLKEAHPDDSRRMILKHKIVSLKNARWMTAGKTTYTTVKPIESRHARFAKNSLQFVGDEVINRTSTNNLTEREEFAKLMNETSGVRKEKTVNLLNQLFSTDIMADQAILLIRNNGDCDMIIRIQGSEYYNLAVPARGENFVTLKKGNYQLSGNMCEARYFASKSIAKNLLVTLTKNSTISLTEKFSVNATGASN